MSENEYLSTRAAEIIGNCETCKRPIRRIDLSSGRNGYWQHTEIDGCLRAISWAIDELTTRVFPAA